MVVLAAKYLIALGVLHIIFGVLRFKAPLAQAFRQGFVGQFAQDDTCRLAFWFICAGPLLGLIGLYALHAAQVHDASLLFATGLCLLALTGTGVLAFPKSPLWALLPPALVFTLAGLGLIN